MADARISQLAAAASLTTAMQVPVNNAGVTQRITLAQVAAFLQAAQGMPIVRQLAADKSISSTTATKASMDCALGVGTYIVNYYLLAQSAAITTAPRFGVNFSTGTVTNKHFVLRYPSTGTTANTGVADDVGASTGQIHESFPFSAFATTALTVGPASLATAAANILFVIEGVIVVTVAGTLELWHAGSAAAATTLKAGSSLMVIQTA